jgi:hypothetical protein
VCYDYLPNCLRFTAVRNTVFRTSTYAMLLNSASALIRPSGALRRSREMPHTYEKQNMEAPSPFAPRLGGCWGLHVLCFHMYEAPPGARGRPREVRIKAEALLSNIVQVFQTCKRSIHTWSIHEDAQSVACKRCAIEAMLPYTKNGGWRSFI